MYSYQPSSEKWNIVKRGTPATEHQQWYLELLGWGREDVTKFGAHILIQDIISAIYESTKTRIEKSPQTLF